ncbi:hypothetical protein HN018_22080 (plasmid) [Lichenicola cladoniae]|uniref:Uncharacterized protein n=1 Tax=Lichenicola cladoniae TaxID=1484109 RepID=A0A6M8HX08_9PROT|nr:hypothetical protein [Lichenicola cladoniae]NPD69748.1 hypothetical protein [Acetobacteraceae bacterium]QKE92918.1 hypothetical protein HN018_22080 [Lichenicola cladoniae]
MTESETHLEGRTQVEPVRELIKAYDNVTPFVPRRMSISIALKHNELVHKGGLYTGNGDFFGHRVIVSLEQAIHLRPAFNIFTGNEMTRFDIKVKPSLVLCLPLKPNLDLNLPEVEVAVLVKALLQGRTVAIYGVHIDHPGEIFEACIRPAFIDYED